MIKYTQIFYVCYFFDFNFFQIIVIVSRIKQSYQKRFQGAKLKSKFDFLQSTNILVQHYITTTINNKYCTKHVASILNKTYINSMHISTYYIYRILYISTYNQCNDHKNNFETLCTYIMLSQKKKKSQTVSDLSTNLKPYFYLHTFLLFRFDP